MNPPPLTLGAIHLGEGRTSFRVWAPNAGQVEVHLTAPREEFFPLEKQDRGYHHGVADNVSPGVDYFYRLDGELERPDPASRWQPHGVHLPSRVLATEFAWTDDHWFGLPLRDYIIYELHVGAFTHEGTFDAAAARLGQLKELGVTAIEIMPVAQFPGARNWGYDGVHPFAAQNSYGGPDGLKRFVNAAHEHGLAVVLDVVYNHLGPEGNYLGDFGPYFTGRYRTPWGLALNFDGPGSDEVRRFFIENALTWQTEFHLDALRLDAVHAIWDFSPVTFLEDLRDAVQAQAEKLNRRFYLIAESDLNMARHIRVKSSGGYGLHAQWSDDFHHSLHVLLTGEQAGYYADYGGVRRLAKAFREGFVYTGEYSAYRRHRHGSWPRDNPVKQFVVYIQNHDQIGNRRLGDRLAASLPLESLKLAAGTVLLSPFIPMLFMGEEYGEKAPFHYFVSHTDSELIEAVRKGRGEEFAAFDWKEGVLDPQAEQTFEHCKINSGLVREWPHAALFEFYRTCLALRKSVPAIARVEKETMEVREEERLQVLSVRYWTAEDEAVVLHNFSEQMVTLPAALPTGTWRRVLDSASKRFGGSGESSPEGLAPGGPSTISLAPRAIAVFRRL